MTAPSPPEQYRTRQWSFYFLDLSPTSHFKFTENATTTSVLLLGGPPLKPALNAKYIGCGWSLACYECPYPTNVPPIGVGSHRTRPHRPKSRGISRGKRSSTIARQRTGLLMAEYVSQGSPNISAVGGSWPVLGVPTPPMSPP